VVEFTLFEVVVLVLKTGCGRNRSLQVVGVELESGCGPNQAF
jgi:hypothetical protein